MKRNMLIFALLILNILQVSAQKTDEVTLVVSADGTTKEEATKVALRSAIEQAYGTFVSANTTILNDDLVKDEIVTISNGNIKQFSEISSFMLPNGNHSVTLQATVSISKLVSYAQSKGASAEFAGQTLFMNLKLDELYAKNEKEAINNMLRQLSSIPSLFDTELILKEPKLNNDKNEITIECVIRLKYNNNLDAFNRIALYTITSLDQSNKKGFDLLKTPFNRSYIPYRNDKLSKWPYKAYLRNDCNLTDKIMKIITDYLSSLKIKSNTGEILFSGGQTEFYTPNSTDVYEHLDSKPPYRIHFRNMTCSFYKSPNDGTIRTFRYGYNNKGIYDLNYNKTVRDNRGSITTVAYGVGEQHIPADFIGVIEGIKLMIPKDKISQYTQFYIEFKN